MSIKTTICGAFRCAGLGLWRFGPVALVLALFGYAFVVRTPPAPKLKAVLVAPTVSVEVSSGDITKVPGGELCNVMHDGHKIIVYHYPQGPTPGAPMHHPDCPCGKKSAE